MSIEEERNRKCRALGILGGEQALYAIITSSVRAPQHLVQRSLTARTLAELGYTEEGMRQLGFDDRALEVLGYIQARQPEAKPERRPQPALSPPEGRSLTELIEIYDANQLKSMGYVIHHVKQEGIDARVAARAGFTLEELAREYTAYDLKIAGFNILELRRHFHGSQLRIAGFAARDMQRDGFSISDLQSFGYNDNQIRTAGFTQNELVQAGMMRQTVDKKGLQRW
jgi:hypothetical protein